jgi:type-F conjugative transfer system secretin TraK
MNRRGLGILGCVMLSYVVCLWTAEATTLALMDHGRAEVTVSGQALNQLTVRGDRIAKVRGSPVGYQLDLDPSEGEAYFMLQSDKPLTLFVTTEHGRHYVLDVFVDRALPSQVVTISPQSPSVPVDSEARLKAAVVTLLRELQEIPPPVAKPVRAYDRHVQSPKRARSPLTQQVVRQVRRENLVGTMVHITNHSQHAIAIPASAWQKPGVIAVVWPHQPLPAKRAYDLYEVRYA